MPAAFQTKPGQDAVEIVGVGLCEADGQAGVSLDTAAERMAELQDQNGKPLTGQALAKAAQAWADSAGLTVGAATTTSSPDTSGEED